MLHIGPKVKAEPELFIYDVHANSPRIVKDDGTIEHADYVRIRNMTEAPYDLTGLFLSDSKGNTLFTYTLKMKPKAPEMSAVSGFYTDEFDLSMSVKGNCEG